MSNKFTPEIVQMLEQIPNAFYALDRDLNFIYANRVVLKLMRKTDEEIIGKNIADLYTTEMHQQLIAMYKNTLATGEEGYFEAYHERLNIWFEIYAYPSDYGLAVYVHDISKRKEVENHLRILNKAGEYLATTHDMDEALTKIGDLIVSDFADWFTVDIMDTISNKVDLLKLSNKDAQKVAWAIDYRSRTHIEIIQPKPYSVGWVIRLGVPVHVSSVNEEILKAASQDNEHLEVLKQLDIQSAMIVPMPYKGKNLGAVTFLSSSSISSYGEADLSFARDLAMRIGVAIENHRMFEAAKRELSSRIRQKAQDSQATLQ